MRFFVKTAIFRPFNKVYALFLPVFLRYFVISHQIIKQHINIDQIMKKYIVLCAGLCLAMSFTGCKSSESAYKKAYEKAQAQAAQQQTQAPVQQTEVPVVTPVQTVPSNQTQVVDNLDNVSVRQERVAVVNGSGLKNYSVVVGSFSVIANAEGLQRRMKNAGYDAQIVKNEERGMYRVIASTFDTKAEAAASRNNISGGEFNPNGDAWLLYYTR